MGGRGAVREGGEGGQGEGEGERVGATTCSVGKETEGEERVRKGSSEVN